MTLPASQNLAREIAQLCENFQIGIFSTATPSQRTIFVGELPASVNDPDGTEHEINEAIWLVEAPSPPPHTYVDTQYTVIDFWARSPETDRAHSLLELVYKNFDRRYHYNTANWHVSFSHALGGIIDIDRDAESGKLLRLSVQFICRNLNNLS